MTRTSVTGSCPAGGFRLADDLEAGCGAEADHRQEARRRRRPHPGQRVEPLEQLVEERLLLRRVRCISAAEATRIVTVRSRIEAGVDAQQRA